MAYKSLRRWQIRFGRREQATREIFFSTSNLVQSMIALASFPDSPRTASNGKLGRAWERGYDCLCHTHIIMDSPI